MIGYLRKFVHRYSALVAPISTLLRGKRFASKRAKKLKVSWGEEQDKALAALILALTSPPILTMPDWDRPFPLHTDASELGAGAVITQIHEGSEGVLGSASHWWSRTNARRSPTERVVTAVLWAVEHFGPYVWNRKFPLITGCSALTWLFKTGTSPPS